MKTYTEAELQQPSQAPALSDKQVDALARLGCGGDDTRWSFSDAGLRRTLEAARAIGVIPIGRFFLRDGEWVRAAPESPVGETLYRRTDGVAVVDEAKPLTWPPTPGIRRFIVEITTQKPFHRWDVLDALHGAHLALRTDIAVHEVEPEATITSGVSPSQGLDTEQLLDKLSDDLWGALAFIDSTTCREEVEKITMRLDEDRRRIADAKEAPDADR